MHERRPPKLAHVSATRQLHVVIYLEFFFHGFYMRMIPNNG